MRIKAGKMESKATKIRKKTSQKEGEVTFSTGSTILQSGQHLHSFLCPIKILIQPIIFCYKPSRGCPRRRDCRTVFWPCVPGAALHRCLCLDLPGTTPNYWRWQTRGCPKGRTGNALRTYHSRIFRDADRHPPPVSV